jgi:hypothetical protein
VAFFAAPAILTLKEAYNLLPIKLLARKGDLLSSKNRFDPLYARPGWPITVTGNMARISGNRQALVPSGALPGKVNSKESIL